MNKKYFNKFESAYLPSLSAIHEPPSDPIAPPIKNIETIADHSVSNSPSDKTLSYRSMIV